MNVVACVLKLFRQELCFFFGVLMLHPQQRRYVFAEFNVKMKDFLFARAEKYAISLIERQIVLYVVFLQ